MCPSAGVELNELYRESSGGGMGSRSLTGKVLPDDTKCKQNQQDRAVGVYVNIWDHVCVPACIFF